MRRAFVRCIPGFGAATGRLSAQQRHFFAEFNDRIAEFQHSFVLLRNVALQVHVTFFQFGQSLSVAHMGIAQQDRR